MTLDTENRIFGAPREASAKPPPRVATVVAPVDLSERSLPAAAYAASLAAGFGSGLVFVHALRQGWPLRPREKEMRERIAAQCGPHRFVFREESPAAATLRTAESERAGLILVPARRKPVLARLVEGSVAARVLRGARCPVWTASDLAAPLAGRPIRKILCALTPGPRAAAVLSWSAGLAARCGAALTIVHASRDLEPHPALPCDREWRFHVEDMAGEEIRALQAAAGTHAAVRLEPGRPLDAIPPLAAHLGADLLVLGKSPERRFLGDFRTLSYEIACRAACPVASV